MSQSMYQQMILDHAKNPVGMTKSPSGACSYAKNPMCGDQIELCVELNGQVIEKISYHAQGCSISVAAASLMTEAMRGKTVEEFEAVMANYLAMIKGEDHGELPKKLATLQGVRQYPMRVKCASFAWRALSDAITKYPPMSIESAVIDYWKGLCEKEKMQGVFIDFKQVGCMGWQFKTKTVASQPEETKAFEMLGLKIFIKASVIENIRGTDVQYITTELGEHKIAYAHPKAKQYCGCGESFFLESI